MKRGRFIFPIFTTLEKIELLLKACTLSTAVYALTKLPLIVSGSAEFGDQLLFIAGLFLLCNPKRVLFWGTPFKTIWEDGICLGYRVALLREDMSHNVNEFARLYEQARKKPYFKKLLTNFISTIDGNMIRKEESELVIQYVIEKLPEIIEADREKATVYQITWTGAGSSVLQGGEECDLERLHSSPKSVPFA